MVHSEQNSLDISFKTWKYLSVKNKSLFFRRDIEVEGSNTEAAIFVVKLPKSKYLIFRQNQVFFILINTISEPA